VAPNGWSDSAFFVNLPFMNQMMWTFILSLVIMLIVSYMENKGADHEKGIPLSRQLFATGKVFNISSTVIIGILIVLYFVFW
jgi:SSS family solute:Na+ symporter